MNIPILLYHSIAQDVTPQYHRWALSPATFAAQMEIVHDQGYTPIHASRLVSVMRGIDTGLPDRPVVITFDDGLADFYQNALPILLGMKYPAALFITTSYVGGTSLWLKKEGLSNYPMLTWEQIDEIASSGVEIGSHGNNHKQLDTLAIEQARDEIVRSRTLLESRLGKTVDFFAYPYGYHSSAVQGLLRLAGYQAAFGVKHAMSSLADDLYALARIIISADTSNDHFSQLLKGNGLRTAPFGEKVHTKAWRTVRRSSSAIKRRMNTENGLPNE